MELNNYTISIGILALAVLILAILVTLLHFRIKKMLGGSSAKNIEEGIQALTLNIKDLHGFRNDTENYLENVEKRLRGTVRGIHTVRFNPFKGTGASGGNQSFATAFINEEGDGVVISSLYTRDHVGIFSKAIKKHSSELELTEEEKEALMKAKGLLI
ncbi:MAG: DUF4446 family protein [bacterium]